MASLMHLIKQQKLTPTKQWLAFDPDVHLRTQSVDVTLPLSEPMLALVAKMVTYVDACYYDLAEKYDIQAGIAIAANQLKACYNIIYIHFDEIINQKTVEHQYLLMNPKIISESVVQSYLDQGEGCLSVTTTHEGLIYRAKKIVVSAYDLINNTQVTIPMDNLLSICCQHEIDHLNGILYYDKINPLNPHEIKTNAIKIAR